MLSRLIAALLCAVALCGCFASALADWSIDTGKTCTLTLTYEKDGVKLDNVKVRLYRVATASKDVKFTLTGKFAAYTTKINNLSSSEWKNATTEIAGYVVRDRIDTITPEQATDSNGVTKFTSLQTGLYLFISDPVAKNGKIYRPQPTLISLPNAEKLANGQYGPFLYDVTAFPKIDVETPTGKDKEFTVVKTWADAGNENKRPTSVTVEIYRNSTLYQTVTLNAANQWKYTWTVPDTDASNWYVVEKNPDGNYTVTYSESGTALTMTFTIKNTYKIPGKPPLVQTGQLWWPVAVLACAGLVVFALGWAVRRRDGEETK